MAADRGRSRRVSIPGVAELFRPATAAPATSDERLATGREKHDHKITVYLSAAELLDLEHARLALRRFGFVVDRGRLVREAITILLADLDARGKDSVIARRLATRDHDRDHGGDYEDDKKDDKKGDGDADGASPIPSLTWAKTEWAPRRPRLPRMRVTRRAAARHSRCTLTCSRGRSTCCSP